MEYVYNGVKYLLDQEKYEDKMFEIIYQYTNHLLDGSINRYDVIVDPDVLKRKIIDELLNQIPSATIIDLSHFETKKDYLVTKENLLKQKQVLITINQNSLIEKLPYDTCEEKESVFYNNIINFLCDSYAKDDINYQEIMFFTNLEYREYIKYAYDISSRSNTVFFNTTLVNEKNKLLTLDSELERLYHNKRN